MGSKLGDLDHVQRYVNPRTGIERLPSNFHLAGMKYPLEEVAPEVARRYPEGVVFDEFGFPDYWPYIVQINGEPGVVKLIELTGMKAIDEYQANQAFGICARSMGLAWHHVQNSTFLVLIDRALERAVVASDGRSTNGPLTPEAYQVWQSRQGQQEDNED